MKEARVAVGLVSRRRLIRSEGDAGGLGELGIHSYNSGCYSHLILTALLLFNDFITSDFLTCDNIVESVLHHQRLAPFFSS
jgi:hypothetical protein